MSSSEKRGFLEDIPSTSVDDHDIDLKLNLDDIGKDNDPNIDNGIDDQLQQLKSFDNSISFHETGSLTPRPGVTHAPVKIFTPAHLRFINFLSKNINNDTKLQKLVKASTRAKVGLRLSRAFGNMCYLIFALWIFTQSNSNFHVTKVVSLLLMVFFVGHAAHFVFLITNSKTAYRIYSLNTCVPNWPLMPITSRQLVYRYQPMLSISELNAIGGGAANQVC